METKIKLAHREQLMKSMKANATMVHNKSEGSKRADELIAGYEERFSEILEEMRVEKKTTNDYAEKMTSFAKRHQSCIQNMCSKLIAESLHDGYQDEQLNAIELQHQVNEYEAMIDYPYEEMDKGEHDFDSVV